MSARDMAELAAVAQAELVRSGEVTAVELVEWAIERIEQINPALNAVVQTSYEQALSGVATVTEDAPLAGVPFLVKDLIAEVDGLAFSEGSRFLQGFLSSYDSELIRAGSVPRA